MKKNIISTVSKRLSILLLLVFSFALVIDYKFAKNTLPTVEDKISIKNIINNNDVIDIFLTKAFNQSIIFKELKLQNKEKGIFTVKLLSKDLTESKKKVFKLRNEILAIQKQVNLDLQDFIETNDKRYFYSKTPIIIDRNDMVNVRNPYRNPKKLEDNNLEDNNLEIINIGYFMVTNNENFLFISLERSIINPASKFIKIYKYIYLLILSLIISLFILYFINKTKKQTTIIKLLKNFT